MPIKPEHLAKDWTVPIYAFFAPRPSIEIIDNRRCCHEFQCGATHCKGKGQNAWIVHRFLDTEDWKSTSNLRKHATHCWGIDIIKEAYEAAENKDIGIDNIWKGLAVVKTQKDGSNFNYHHV